MCQYSQFSKIRSHTITQWPVCTILAFTHLPFTSGESIGPSQATTGLNCKGSINNLHGHVISHAIVYTNHNNVCENQCLVVTNKTHTNYCRHHL